MTAASDVDRTLVPRLQEELADLQRKIRAIHQEFEGRCTHCVEWCDCLDGDDDARVADCAHGNVGWPCPTIRALA